MTAAPVFGKDHAAVYDWVYAADKDYEAEAAFLDTTLKRYGRGRVRSVLDLGCGTGGHALRLGALGYEVTGVDASASMLDVARAKAAASAAPVGFVHGRLQDFRVGRPHDAAVCCFAVFSYLVAARDVHRTLANVRRQLAPDGLLVFDFWNWPVFRQGAARYRVKDLRDGDRRLLRLAETVRRPRTRVFDVRLSCLLLDGDRVAADFVETHPMRAFDLTEVRTMLVRHGFTVLKACSFPEPGRRLDRSFTLHVTAKRQGS